MKVYQEIAKWVEQAQRGGQPECKAALEALVNQTMPSGSGIDCDTKLDYSESSANKLVFTFEFHHMNSGGFYSGWTRHTATVKPNLARGFDLFISGRDRNQIKEYLYDTYDIALEAEIREIDKEVMQRERQRVIDGSGYTFAGRVG